MYELIDYFKKYDILEQMQGKLSQEKFAVLAATSQFLKEEIGQNFELLELAHNNNPGLVKTKLSLIAAGLGIFLENALYKDIVDWTDYSIVENTYFDLVKSLNQI